MEKLNTGVVKNDIFAACSTKVRKSLEMTTIDRMKRILFLLSAFTLFLFINADVKAQYDEYSSEESSEENPDSSESDSYEDSGSDSYDSYDSYDGGGGSSANGIELQNGGKVGKPIAKKEYVRFQPPLDTITKLITYLDIVEVKDQEGYEAYADSMYTRAQRWLSQNYDKKQLKEYIKENGVNAKGEGYIILMEGQFPLLMKPNEFTTQENGKVLFTMELRFKDGRYRYKINNLVHVQPPAYGASSEIKTYMEFYTKTKRDVQSTDKILLATDQHIKKMIQSLHEQVKEPIIVDEDDW